jgi:hypothetical protein
VNQILNLSLIRVEVCGNGRACLFRIDLPLKIFRLNSLLLLLLLRSWLDLSPPPAPPLPHPSPPQAEQRCAEALHRLSLVEEEKETIANLQASLQEAIEDAFLNPKP